MDQATLAIASQGNNVAKFDESGMIFESDILAESDVITFIWSTNENTKAYQTNVFASVFDAELIEAQGSVSDFLAGIR